MIDSEIKRIIKDAYDRSCAILRENIDKLHFIAKFLVDHETMDDAQFTAVMEGEPTVEELEAMMSERERISREENERRREIEEAEERERREAEARESERYDRDERDRQSSDDTDKDNKIGF